MRKALIYALLLGAVLLGASVFRAQLVNAAPPPPPPQNVVVQNTSTNAVPIRGTVGLDPTGNTVNLDSTDSAHLADIESALGSLKPAPVTAQCLNSGQSTWVVNNDTQLDTLCTDDVYATDITAASMDDVLQVDFSYQGNVVLSLDGSGNDGADSYQLDLTHPLHFDKVTARCGDANNVCIFTLAVLGNSTGN